MSDESRLPDLQKKIPYPFTAVPNSYLDEWMRTLGKKPNAKLAMIYIFRRTVGWEGRPLEAAITLKEFRAFIGIEHDATVETALKVLRDAGLITIRQEGGSKSVKLYRLTPKAFQSAKIRDASANFAKRDPAASAKIEDTHLQESQRGISKNRRTPSSEIAEAESQQHAQSVAPGEGKETKEKEKESVAASPRSPSGSPRVSEEQEEEEREEHPDIVTLRNDYATLSQQLAQLDARKQTGQWARLYKQVKAAEVRLRQTEQDTPPSQASPPEYATLRVAQASEGGTALPPAEVAAADERRERLRAVASDLLSWKEGLKVLRQAQLPKWRGSFKWQIEAKIEALQVEYATLRAEGAKPDG